ncbi:MAG TPA: hypothetical protein EYN66_05045 [Myxococcales bacterium]|nr:hypothetical protein [Myxococcales bacterium]
MSHNASDAQKLLSVDTVTTAGTTFSVTKGLTASSANVGGIRTFLLPDPATIPAGMSYEIKDSNGTAGTTANKIVVAAPAGIQIDGSDAADEITKAWGSKTYVSLGGHYIVRGDQRSIAATPSGGGVYNQSFPGADGDALPTGWSSSMVGDGIPWLVSTDTYYSTLSSNTSSLGSDLLNDSAAFPGAGNTPAISTLTYTAGNLIQDQIVSFKWLDDTYHYYNTFRFKVNGSFVLEHGIRYAWEPYSYIIPSTGNYTFEWDTASVTPLDLK